MAHVRRHSEEFFHLRINGPSSRSLRVQEVAVFSHHQAKYSGRLDDHCPVLISLLIMDIRLSDEGSNERTFPV